MSRKIKDFHEAWHFLYRHPIFGSKGELGRRYPSSRFADALDIEVVKTDARGRINDDKTKNTYTRVWLECGPIKEATSDEIDSGIYSRDAIQSGVITHDINLDCGGKTFEEAVIKLANLVIKHHGDHPSLLEQMAEAADE